MLQVMTNLLDAAEATCETTGEGLHDILGIKPQNEDHSRVKQAQGGMAITARLGHAPRLLLA